MHLIKIFYIKGYSNNNLLIQRLKINIGLFILKCKIQCIVLKIQIHGKARSQRQKSKVVCEATDEQDINLLQK